MIKWSKLIQNILRLPILLGSLWLPHWTYLLVMILSATLGASELVGFYIRYEEIDHLTRYDLTALSAAGLLLISLIGIIVLSISLYKDNQTQPMKPSASTITQEKKNVEPPHKHRKTTQ